MGWVPMGRGRRWGCLTTWRGDCAQPINVADRPERLAQRGSERSVRLSESTGPQPRRRLRAALPFMS